MTQFQAEVPDPLRDDLPGFLSASGVAAPTIRVLFAIFIRPGGSSAALSEAISESGAE